MSLVEELFGQQLSIQRFDLQASRMALCPFMDEICDGGGNRDMSRISATDSDVGHFFDKSVGKSTGGFLPCGVCSVRLSQKDEVWAICPRRLLTFGPNGFPRQQSDLAMKIFEIAGYKAKQVIYVWSEISLRETAKSGRRFNYRFDYVLSNSESGNRPTIVEVMTCSTSGGNKRKGTDIQEAFKNSVLFANKAPSTNENVHIQAPGINVRQVWARMASQIIAKSEVANKWGGRAIWVVQDKLVDYIRRNTALPLDDLLSPSWEPGEVNMLVSDLTRPVALYSGPIRSSGSSEPCWMELLGVPYIPRVSSIQRKLQNTNPIASFRLA